MVRHLDRTLSQRPYIAGEKFTAADTQLGGGIHFAINILGVLPKKPSFMDHLGRVTARPAFQRSAAREAAAMGG
ncbi:MAG: hypothetical protein H0T56_10000 [Pseudaminobacter sp.]|nr:hypothetical protein [Pseudaminobacter sp.]